jgi:hypothetical protein
VFIKDIEDLPLPAAEVPMVVHIHTEA